ncbi:hypothetical protein ACLB1E_08775 [Escherichia coli]
MTTLSGGADFAILRPLQQFNKVLAYEVRMLMTDKLQLEDGTQLVVPPLSVGRSTVSWSMSVLQRGCRRGRSASGTTL